MIKMKKKGNASSSTDRRKNNKSSTNNNNKDTQIKPKQILNKSVEKRRNVGLSTTTEPGYIATTESKSQKDKYHLTKQRKDNNKPVNQKGANSRSSKTNKTNI